MVKMTVKEKKKSKKDEQGVMGDMQGPREVQVMPDLTCSLEVLATQSNLSLVF